MWVRPAGNLGWWDEMMESQREAQRSNDHLQNGGPEKEGCLGVTWDSCGFRAGHWDGENGNGGSMSAGQEGKM